MLLNWIRSVCQRRMMKKIRHEVENDHNIPKDDRDEEITRRRARIREEKGWTDGVFSIDLDPWSPPIKTESDDFPFGGN